MLIPLGQFFESNIGALARKVLAAVGVGTITFAAIKTAFDAALAFVRSNYDSLPADIFALAGLFGIGDALGMITGAMAFSILFKTTAKLGVIPK